MKDGSVGVGMAVIRECAYTEWCRGGVNGICGNVKEIVFDT